MKIPGTHRPLWQWRASEMAAAARSGTVSCHEITAAAVERMREVNPRLNAVTLDLGDAALAAAARLDSRRLKGDAPGPLFGVPVTVKDNVDVRGQRTPNGVTGLAEVTAPNDSPVVKNLLDAGAVIVGRTNTPEFSMRATTNNALYGLTLNPWDARISCGGSSGGAGAAVASGICAIGHGNDIAGSIRYPALHCGVAGLKPTPGRIPAYVPSGTVERPLLSSLMSVQGPLARCVSDLGLALGPMASSDPRDPWWVGAPLDGPPAARKVGLIADIPGLRIAPVVAQSLRDAARALEQTGYIVEPIDVPDIARSGELALRLLTTDLQQQILPAARRMGSDQIRWYFEAWFATVSPYRDTGEYLDALAARNTLLRQWLLLLETHPVILLPERVDALLEVDEDLRSADHLHHILWGLAPSIIVNLLGLPAVMVPTGLGDGLPAGVQLVAGRYREDLCLAAAAAIESVVGTLVEQLWSRL
jgi:amidase